MFFGTNNMIYGYARVSTKDQNLDMQIEALKKYNCDEIITEKKVALLLTALLSKNY